MCLNISQIKTILSDRATLANGKSVPVAKVNELRSEGRKLKVWEIF